MGLSCVACAIAVCYVSPSAQLCEQTPNREHWAASDAGRSVKGK